MPDARCPSPAVSNGSLGPVRPWWQSRWERLGWILFAGLLVGFFPFVISRTTRHTSSDFWLFYGSAQHVWELGTRMPKSKFLHYLPSMDAAFGLLTWMPMFWAAIVWSAIMVAGWLCVLAAVRRYLLCGYDGTQARQAVLAAALLMMPLFINHLCVGAFHILMVWFMVAGLGRVSQNRPWSGGLLLGLAVWIKLLPLVGVGYLLLKRKWLPAVVAILAALVVDLVLSLAAYGPATTWRLHIEWWQSEVIGEQRMLTDAQSLDEDRPTNQSIMIVMRHLLTTMGQGPRLVVHDEAAQFGMEAEKGGDTPDTAPLPNLAIANLTPRQLQIAYAVVMALLATAVVIYCQQHGRELGSRQWGTEIALVVLSTLWFSPLVWSYHPTAALPALALILARSPQFPRLTQATAALWVVCLVLMGYRVARVLGATLWMSLFLGVVLVWTARREAVGPAVAEGEGRRAKGE
jgi:hypothetical protein